MQRGQPCRSEFLLAREKFLLSSRRQKKVRELSELSAPQLRAARACSSMRGIARRTNILRHSLGCVLGYVLTPICPVLSFWLIFVHAFDRHGPRARAGMPPQGPADGD